MTTTGTTALPSILTGIDLPYDSPGGSVELLRDLYLGPDPLVPADVFMLPAGSGAVSASASPPTLLSVQGKAVSGGSFWSYVDRLSSALEGAFSVDDYEVIHLQHLAFGATPALQRVFPEQAKIALVHGTDLLYAAENRTQAEVLRATADTADAIVVPTEAMADNLRQVTPVAPDRIVHIPWGIPDQLLGHKEIQTRRHSDTLRILYAGRLTSEKAAPKVLSAVTELGDVELAIAAPLAEYHQFAKQGQLSNVRYLGWLSRENLWREFTKYDLLIIPSLKLEAFGLVAIEAQACGLPVAYQPVPGLTEVLGDSGISLDFGDFSELAKLLRRISASREYLDDMASAGLANSKRFPLSKAALELCELSSRLTR